MGGLLSKTESANLSDMPMIIAYKVLEKMDPTDQLTARKVSRSVRTAIDKIGISFNKITLKLGDRKISMELDVDKPYGKCIQYRDERIMNRIVKTLWNGQKVDRCTDVITSCGRSTRIEKENLIHTVCRDLKIVLKHASRIEFDVIEFEESLFSCHTDIYFVNSFAPVIEGFHVKEVCFINFYSEYVYEMLPIFDATTLKSIELRLPNNFRQDKFEKIAQLDQWKNIKEFKLRRRDGWFDSNMLAYLLHLQSFTIEQTHYSFPIQSVVQIRDAGSYKKKYISKLHYKS